ncbi:3-oxoacyl-[acyl-carrier-protein] reductase [Botrimarina mediterranea]|uniref:3-oxoacyl-[acyl-carrier-protein] reductase n=1 Tax=Botrimarina mediterranea TaxID=2528022 RepID=A0A518KCH9_9BACT|nr:3-oxoacyl-[acyl-carrier-protein] reductase [Botrimarina mediterranea]QDV75497.1 3-oxoacyl-[acyl-carrier-protein] reductase FabG [Botrimarina mediterranea]QDV80130.1 3-oxoacyl-[acyl-carrier-protein] reductase FabG [Planctomycetes bacterium K2D]
MPSRINADLTDQVAIVTGASRGIGKAIALRLAAAGAKVACVARSADKLAETVAEITAGGGTAEAIPCDVADSDAATKLVEGVAEKWGRVDVMVNNAGITRDTLLPRMSDDDWDSVIATNLRSVFLFTRAATGPMMRAKKGRIINISSTSGLRGNEAQCNYSASKAGVIGFTQTVARELASKRRQITVNAICPGFIATDMTAALKEAAGEEAVMERIKAVVPLQRQGEAEEVADAVLFLASDSAAYITGQTLVIDGGMTC